MTDRTWSLPDRKFNLRMGWHDLLFMHWPVDPTHIEKFLPGLSVDTYNGVAWVAIVPFRMSDVAPRGVPAFPWLSQFPELNVRTYVTIDEKPGVWFFSLDATNPLAVRVARSFFHLPYYDAEITIRQKGDAFVYAANRTHRGETAARLETTYRPIGNKFHAEPGTFEHWLTARYCFYTIDRQGNLLRGEIDHPAWSLQRAEAETSVNSMLDWLALPYAADEPHLLFAKDVSVQAWSNEKVVLPEASKP